MFGRWLVALTSWRSLFLTCRKYKNAASNISKTTVFATIVAKKLEHLVAKTALGVLPELRKVAS